MTRHRRWLDGLGVPLGTALALARPTRLVPPALRVSRWSMIATRRGRRVTSSFRSTSMCVFLLPKRDEHHAIRERHLTKVCGLPESEKLKRPAAAAVAVAMDFPRGRILARPKGVDVCGGQRALGRSESSLGCVRWPGWPSRP